MSDANHSSTVTIAGWTAIVVLVGGIWYSQQNKGKKTTVPHLTKGAARGNTDAKKENKAKKQRLEAFASDSQKASATEKESVPANNTWLTNNSDDTVDNKDFAKRLSSVKQGTKFTSKTSDSEQKRQKSVKQSRAAKVSDFEGDDKASAPSSTAGVDADDDQSPVVSPEVAAVDASGVSDMLEPAPSGPSILRLTDTDKVKAKPKQVKAPEQVESKKQRQNRKKAEAAKAAREEEEKERKVLMEKQRRTARVAEGRPAKDGSQFVASTNGTKPSVWTAGAPNGNSKTEPINGGYVSVQPLDTFEAPTSKGSGIAAPALKGTSDSWLSSLPSEEEQMELLKEDTEDWNTVKTKTSKKTKKDSPSGSIKGATTQARPVAQAVQKPTTNGKAAKPTTSFGSFSALTTDDDDEVAEQEWDV